ncbi:hypothetical protein P029_03720 [Anaplasma phagocytophilum str. Norway variant2]|uniref:Uncharacterized protein n=2 Tax=Anaplasma phagocytophilum TaxID=948 RepID=A0A161IR74_ANAPH|nr:hypothetical protein P029_03720 [Anaplasma phagocytophilum str. Norway variant2]
MVALFYLVASVCLRRRKHRDYSMKTGFSFRICRFCKENFLEVIDTGSCKKLRDNEQGYKRRDACIST